MRRLASLILLLGVACGSGNAGPSTGDDAGALDALAPIDASIPLDASIPIDLAVAADLATPDLAPAPGDLAITGQRVRLVAANITSGNKQAYETPGIHIFQGLQPDVAMLQEFNYGGSTAPEIRSFVDQAFGANFVYYREAGGGLTIPNGVVSRYPIVDSGSWDDPTINNRGFAWARIDVPGARDLWAVSVHLSTTNGDRPQAAAALVAAIQGKVPAGDLLVIGGDCNTDARNEVAVMTLGAIVVTVAPWPADQNGNGNTSGPRSRPYDWVMLDGDLAAREIPVEIGASRYWAGLVFDSRVYMPIAEVAPVVVGDSAATGMQHMAVVRDVALEP